MIKDKIVRSEIVFEQKERIKSIELVHNDRKFVVSGLPDKEPLFKYLNPDIVKQYAHSELTESVKVNEHLTVEPYAEEKKNFRIHKA